MPDGTKPLPEPMLSKFFMPYDFTRPQWVKVWIHWPLQGVAIVLKIIFENISLATCEIAFSWKPQNLTHVKSTLILVKAWCHQATSHYQCTWKTFMIHQTFVRWALYILFKFVKSLIGHLGLAIGNVRCVRWFSWTLHYLSQCWSRSLLPYGITRLQ